MANISSSMGSTLPPPPPLPEEVAGVAVTETVLVIDPPEPAQVSVSVTFALMATAVLPLSACGMSVWLNRF